MIYKIVFVLLFSGGGSAQISYEGETYNSLSECTSASQSVALENLENIYSAYPEMEKAEIYCVETEG